MTVENRETENGKSDEGVMICGKNAIHDTTEAVFRGRVRSITLLKSSFRTAEKPLSGLGKACLASRKSLFGHAERAFR